MLESDLAAIAERKAKIKELESEIDDIITTAGYRNMHPGTYAPDNGGSFILEVSRNARFDSAIATELYPLGENGENMHLYSAKVDGTLAKKFLTEEEYELCQKVFPNNRVEVKALNVK